jgi:hypothetical protein
MPALALPPPAPLLVKTHARMKKLAHSAVGVVAEYATVEAAGARVLAGLHDVASRLALAERARSGGEGHQSRRLLGPLAAFPALPAGLVASLRAEAAKQQRNVVQVLGMLGESEEAVVAAEREMVAVWEGAGGGGTAGAVSSSAAAFLHTRTPQEPLSVADLLYLVHGLKGVLAVDLTAKGSAAGWIGGAEATATAAAAEGEGGADDGASVGRPFLAPDALEAAGGAWASLRGRLVGGNGDGGGGGGVPSVGDLVWRLTGGDGVEARIFGSGGSVAEDGGGRQEE